MEMENSRAVCKGRMLGITYRRHTTGPVMAKVTYSYDYDAAGNRTAKRTLATTASYGYDSLNQLTSDGDSADLRGPLAYRYDAAGNRTHETWGGNDETYGYGNPLNRLASAANGPYGSMAYSYDFEGNRIAKAAMVADGVVEQEGSSSYQWDGKNRLTQVTLPDSSTINYAYDYQNRMVSRTKGSEVRTYLYGSGTQVLEETLNGQRLALYGWGADGLDSRIDANGQSLFYLKDALGSVIAIVDDRGSVVQSYEYSAYGECLSGKDAVNAFRLVGGAGGRADDATGLVYFWNRWYDPQVGRWVSEDPIRETGGLNLFGYVDNSPASSIDPNGLKKLTFEEVYSYASSYNLSDNFSAELLTCMAWKESTFDPDENTSGALGLLQVRNIAIKDLNDQKETRGYVFNYDASLYDPAMNMEAGSAYLQLIYKRYRKGDVKGSLDFYGTGPGYSDNILACETCLKEDPCHPEKALGKIKPVR